MQKEIALRRLHDLWKLMAKFILKICKLWTFYLFSKWRRLFNYFWCRKRYWYLSFSDPGTVPVLVDPGTEAIGVPTVRRFWITDDKNCWLALSYKSKQIWYAMRRLSSFTSFSKISLTAWGSSKKIKHWNADKE